MSGFSTSLTDLDNIFEKASDWTGAEKVTGTQYGTKYLTNSTDMILNRYVKKSTGLPYTTNYQINGTDIGSLFQRKDTFFWYTTGGTINYTITGYSNVVAFTTNGTFCCNKPISNFRYIIVGGGGPGGLSTERSAGSGGAGGDVQNNKFDSLPAGSYEVTVGSGGTAGTLTIQATYGGNSAFNGVTARGGQSGGYGFPTNKDNYGNTLGFTLGGTMNTVDVNGGKTRNNNYYGGAPWTVLDKITRNETIPKIKYDNRDTQIPDYRGYAGCGGRGGYEFSDRGYYFVENIVAVDQPYSFWGYRSTNTESTITSSDGTKDHKGVNGTDGTTIHGVCYGSGGGGGSVYGAGTGSAGSGTYGKGGTGGITNYITNYGAGTNGSGGIVILYW